MDPLHPLQLHHPLVAVGQLVVQLLGRSLHQDRHRVGEHRPDGHPDQDGDEDGADGVGDHPAESPHQDGRDDHPRAAQRVSQDVEEHALRCKALINFIFEADQRDTAVFHPSTTGDAIEGKYVVKS